MRWRMLTVLNLVVYLKLVEFTLDSFMEIYYSGNCCSNGIKNYDETGVDCGGSCGECSGGVTWIWVVGIIILVGIVVFIKKKRN